MTKQKDTNRLDGKGSSCCDYFIFMDGGKAVRSGSWNEKTKQYVSEYFRIQR